jgi:hypothetical protein
MRKGGGKIVAFVHFASKARDGGSSLFSLSLYQEALGYGQELDWHIFYSYS